MVFVGYRDDVLEIRRRLNTALPAIDIQCTPYLTQLDRSVKNWIHFSFHKAGRIMMDENVSRRWKVLPFLVCTGVFVSVYGISNSNYLLFHSLAELFSMGVSMAVFIIAWNTRKHLDNTALLIIGVAYLFISGIDLLHTLAYQGMGVFKGGKTNLPTQLWISARLLQSLTFFIAPFFLHRNISIKAIFFSYTGFAALLLFSIFIWKIFPECHVEGIGLTPFKKNCEYLISIILLLSIFLFFRSRKFFDGTVFRYIIASICLTIAGELAFTLYIGVYDLSNFLGHYFKIISFYLIYKAIVETGLTRPYDVLFRNLKLKETALAESEAKYRSMMESITDPVYIASPDFKVAFMNPAMISMVGRDETGKTCFQSISGNSNQCDFCVFPEIKRENTIVKETLRQKDGRYYHVTHSPICHTDGSISKLTIFRDVTDLKQIEFECRRERDKARLYLDIIGNIVVVLHADTTVALINKKGCELLGWPEKEVIGKKWFDTFVPESDRESAKSAFQAVTSGVAPDFEYFQNRIVGRHGNERIISWHNVVLRNEAGEIIGSLSSGDDITASKQLQAELLWELNVNSALSDLYAPLISPDITLAEAAGKILEKIMAVTGSDYGYVSAINPDSADGVGCIVADMMPEQYARIGKAGCPAFSEADYVSGGFRNRILKAEVPLFINTPEDHESERLLSAHAVPVKKMLCAPVVFNEHPIGRIVLFNKEEDYGKKEIEAVSRFARHYALAVNRLQIKESMNRAKQELELRVEERTRDLSHSNVMLIKEIEERKILEQNLLKSESELKDLSEKLIRSYEEERRRVGEELHDGLAQTLSAIKVWSDAALAQMGKKRVEEAMKSVRSILAQAKGSVTEVRNIIKNLRPGVLDDLGLGAAISWLGQEFEKMHPGIDLQKEIKLIDEERISENLKIVIFRIVQEALNNISKHSGSTAVSLLLDQTGQSLKMKVWDNGIGFDTGAAKTLDPTEKGIGLSSMQERARLSGGVFSITSSPGKGAAIEVDWEMGAV